MSNLLLHEKVIALLPSLANRLGLNEAIVTQQVFWRITFNRDNERDTFRDGRWWVFMTIEDWWEREFTWWSLPTVKRTFKNLEEMGLLLTDFFDKGVHCRRKWYTVDHEAVERLASLDPQTGRLKSEERVRLIRQHLNGRPDPTNPDRTIGSKRSDQFDPMVKKGLDQIDPMVGQPLDQIDPIDIYREIKNKKEDLKQTKESAFCAIDRLLLDKTLEVEPEPTSIQEDEVPGQLPLIEINPVPVNSSKDRSDPPPVPPGSPLPPKTGKVWTVAELARLSPRELDSLVIDLPRYEAAWKAYVGFCKLVDQAPGSKKEGKAAWIIDIQSQGLESDVEKGLTLFIEQNRKRKEVRGIPHFVRFLRGSDSHPDPYWQSAIDLAETDSEIPECFNPENRVSINSYDAATDPDRLARLRAIREKHEAKRNGLTG
ncbi:MAG TPA: hypothetical protein V6C65_04190 [Allocoleopsis sp.]